MDNELDNELEKEFEEYERELNALKSEIESVGKRLDKLEQDVADIAKEMSLDIPNTDTKYEDDKYILVELKQERCCDHGGYWIEDKFVPFNYDGKLFFKSIDEATQHVMNNLDTFAKIAKKVYVQNIATGKVTKIKKGEL